MSEIKSHEFNGLLQRKSLPYGIFVIYGPDRGLVSERAGEIARMTGVALNDPFSLIKIDASELSSRPGLIVDEMQSLGLFGGSRLVWVKGAANEKPLIDALQSLSTASLEGSTLIVEAGDLKKGTGTRKVAEAARSIACIACYPDDRAALNELIDAELGPSGLRITPAARALLTDNLGGDRLASRNEIRKLALYCRDDGTIDEQHVLDIIGDASSVSTDDAVDAVLSGDVQAFLHAAEKVVHSKTPLFLVLQGCLKQFQMLDIMRAEMDEKKTPASQVMQTLGRHIFYKRKAILERALKTWSAPAIAREMNRIQAAIFQSRQRSSLEESIVLHTLLSTTIQSGRKP